MNLRKLVDLLTSPPENLADWRSKTLMRVLAASALVFVFSLAIFGSVVVLRSVLEERTMFTTPPPIKTYQPRELEHKVKVQKRQRSSSRPTVMPRLVSAKPSNFALPEIKTDPKVVKTTFQPQFKAVTGIGLGSGLGTGFGVGGFGTGVSAFNFFGIQGRGEKIAVLVDVSISMIEAERGGPEGFERVKARINQVVDALNEKTLFNVVAFADAAQTFQEQMVPATEQYKKGAKDFISPYNTRNNLGLDSGNVRAINTGIPAVGGTTRLDLALTAAFQMGADTILLISDGLPQVQKGMTSDQRAAWDARMREWNENNRGAMEAYERAIREVQYTTRRVWVPPTPATPPSPAVIREGHMRPASPGRPAQPGHWREERVPDRPLPHRPQPPGMPDSMKWWTIQDFYDHFARLHEMEYVKKGRKLPVVHTIGYAIDKEGGDFLKAFTERYKGTYRRISKI